MSFSESSDSDWNINYPIKKKKKGSDEVVKKSKTSLVKRRNFREKWLRLFSPWLTRSEDDPSLPFCRACQCNLGNNGYRLQRHEKTAKHIRNQEILLNEGEDAIHIRLNRRSPTKKSEPMKMNAVDIKEQKINKFESSLEKEVSESPYLYKKRDYHVPRPSYSQHYYQPMQSPMQHQYLPFPQPERDCFDMFFDAISATVKRLPPKLGAEVKGRVSQVIAEFELRAICEKEAQERAQQQSVIAIPTQVTNLVTIDPIITTGTNGGN